MSTEVLLTGGGGAESRCMTIDDVLALHTGEFGRWQLRHFVLVSLAWTLEAMHTMIMIFADREPVRACAARDGRCSDQCAGAAAGWEWSLGSGSSTAAEWGLVCGERYMVALVQAIFFVGCMIDTSGAGVFGHLSDSFLGRKGSLVVLCFLNAVLGLLTALSPNYWVYAALRLLTGFSTSSVGFCSFVLATEPIGPSHRGTAGISTMYFFSGGIAALVAVAAMFQSSWRLLYVATSLPSLAFVLLVMPFVSESPRWYLVRGRADDAMRVLRDIASTNGRRIPDDVTLMLDGDVDDTKEPLSSSSSTSGSTILDAFRSRTARVRLVLSVVVNFICSVVYFGLSLNVVNLETDLYISVAANALVEMPACLVTTLLLQHFGRNPVVMGTMLLSGVSCIAGSLVTGAGAIRMACGVVGIFRMGTTYNLLVVYTAELFPTVVRTAVLGCTAQAMQMGAILAPLVVVHGDRVPFGLFGVSGIIGGLLVFSLPETMNIPLYDTLAGLKGKEHLLHVKTEMQRTTLKSDSV